MPLTPEQTQAVTSWIVAGDNLSAVQKKLAEQFQLSMTYRDVRFLVDDLNLELKDPAPKIDASDVTKSPPPKTAASAPAAARKRPSDPASDHGGAPDDDGSFDEPEAADAGELEEGLDELPPDSLGNVSVTVDKVTLIPSALASGTVTFSDGVTAKWVVDQQGRPGFTEVSKPGYRPTPSDGQAFMQELSTALQKRGF